MRRHARRISKQSHAILDNYEYNLINLFHTAHGLGGERGRRAVRMINRRRWPDLSN